jgi:hypothetical protein
MSTRPGPRSDHAPTINQVTERLAAAYAGRVTATDVHAVVGGVYADLAGARIQTFVPIFVERRSREVLDAWLTR